MAIAREANCRLLRVSVTEDKWGDTVTIRDIRQFPPRLRMTIQEKDHGVEESNEFVACIK